MDNIICVYFRNQQTQDCWVLFNNAIHKLRDVYTKNLRVYVSEGNLIH